MDHARALVLFVIAGSIRGHRPRAPAVFVATVAGEEGADARATKIGGTVGALRSGDDDGIREDDAVGVGSALQIAEQALTTGDVVGEMGQRLHCASPGDAGLVPAAVGVEFLVVLDERLHKQLCASFLTVCQLPNSWSVDHDHLVNETLLIPFLDDVDGLVDGLDIRVKVVRLIDTAGLELLGNALFSSAWATRVVALVDVAECTLVEYLVHGYFRIGRVILSGGVS
mmetsp:Transcript_10874/g.30023  ORF Transcript_10874/g.30023 Transcript_10874/m.30023 type:complete len:227 (+) Transcript_10874:298-978(+)